MFRWITVMAHVWPGITPLNVWDMRYDMWLRFVGAAKAWEEAQKKQEKPAPRRPGRR